jgi:hypothetical protein
MLFIVAVCCCGVRAALAGYPPYVHCYTRPLDPLRARIASFDETCHGRDARRRAAREPWHGPYYRYGWERPVALVVPPTAERQTDYGWGVGGTRVTRINHQFQRPYPGDFPFGAMYPNGFLPTPPWPSDTRQFGVYYVRGPW